jgi:hypothetical protein
MSDWHPIANAPFERDLELSVIEKGEVHALAFPCQRTSQGWTRTANRRPVLIGPTHWREWAD